MMALAEQYPFLPAIALRLSGTRITFSILRAQARGVTPGARCPRTKEKR